MPAKSIAVIAALALFTCGACSLIVDTSGVPLKPSDTTPTASTEDKKGPSASLGQKDAAPLKRNDAAPVPPDTGASRDAVSETAGSHASDATSTVLLISVDGLAPRFVESELQAGRARTFVRLQREGAFTHNARTEARISVTLPNHLSMITSRPAQTVPGAPLDTEHGFFDNHDPGDSYTVHAKNPNLTYLPSVFDEVHDRGGYTSLYAGKSKFLIFRRSYSSPASRLDLIGDDNGRNKIDDFDVLSDSSSLVAEFMQDFAQGVERHPRGPNFALLHFHDTDSTGHAYGWGSPEYLSALERVDTLLGNLLNALQAHPALSKTIVILTSDHGGVDYGHFDPSRLEIVTIPFYVWGTGISGGVDLYELSQGTRTDPGDTIPMDESGPQPIRNGDAGNLALWLMGLSPLQGSWHTGMQLRQ